MTEGYFRGYSGFLYLSNASSSSASQSTTIMCGSHLCSWHFVFAQMMESQHSHSWLFEIHISRECQVSNGSVVPDEGRGPLGWWATDSDIRRLLIKHVISNFSCKHLQWKQASYYKSCPLGFILLDMYYYSICSRGTYKAFSVQLILERQRYLQRPFGKH